MKAAYILFGIILFTILSSFTILSTAVDTINGLVKDGITLCTSATPDSACQLMDGTNAFPSSGILRNFHYDGLQDSTYAWRGNNYDYREQVDISGVTMRHSWSTSDINGTPKIQIDSGDVIYEWVAEELLNGTGTWNFKNLTNPVNITMLNKTFSIVSTNGDNSISVLLDGNIKTYDISADTASSGPESDRFPGTTDWGIQVKYGSFPAGTAGSIPSGSTVQVVYKPTNSKYLKQNEKIVFPNNYAELGYLGFNTDNFATITINPITSVTAYNYSADTQSFGNLNGFEISSDVAGSIVAPNGNAYSKAYVLFNKSYGTRYPVFFGYYDQSKQKILVNGTLDANNETTVAEYVSKLINGFNITDKASYAFKLNYGSVGETDFYLNVTIKANSSRYLVYMVAGTAASNSINMTWQNKTVWSGSTNIEFRLGTTNGASDPADVEVTTEAVARQQIGETVQDVLDDSGITVVSPDANANADKVVIKVPAKSLANKVYFGKLISETPTTTTTTTTPPTTTTTTTPSSLEQRVLELENKVSLLEIFRNKFIYAICSIRYASYFSFCPPKCPSGFSCSTTCVDDTTPSICYDRTSHPEYFCTSGRTCCESQRVTCPS